MSPAILITALALVAAPDGNATAAKAKKAPSAKTLATAQMILEQRVPPNIRAGGMPLGGQNTQDPTSRSAASLIDLLQSTIAPNSWDIRGGEGSIVYFSPGSGLVVRQTGAGHQGVGNVLQQMRRN